MTIEILVSILFGVLVGWNETNEACKMPPPERAQYERALCGEP